VFGKSQRSAIGIADEKLRIYWVWNVGKEQCWSYLRNIRTTINYFFTNVAHIIYPYFSYRQNLAQHWDLPNTGIFNSKDVASEQNPFRIQQSADQYNEPSYRPIQCGNCVSLSYTVYQWTDILYRPIKCSNCVSLSYTVYPLPPLSCVRCVLIPFCCETGLI
jgi:hypothetical protein